MASASWSERLPAPVVRALRAAVGYGVDPASLALYARWWQLETWLRELLYVELRARDGQGWVDALGQRTLQRQSRDSERAYMASPDWVKCGDVVYDV